LIYYTIASPRAHAVAESFVGQPCVLDVMSPTDNFSLSEAARH
jgi:hypothetical protein